jgi:prevent-host-death family protein
MGQIAVAALKGSLSEQLRKVKSGEELTITERGVPIARIVPVTAAGSALDAVRDLAAQGAVRLPTCPLPPGFTWDRRVGDTGAVRALLAEREEGR